MDVTVGVCLWCMSGLRGATGPREGQALGKHLPPSSSGILCPCYPTDQAFCTLISCRAPERSRPCSRVAQCGEVGWDGGPCLPVWRAGLSLVETSPHGSEDFLSPGPTFLVSSVKVFWRTMEWRLRHLEGRKVGQGLLRLPLNGAYSTALTSA